MLLGFFAYFSKDGKVLRLNALALTPTPNVLRLDGGYLADSRAAKALETSPDGLLSRELRSYSQSYGACHGATATRCRLQAKGLQATSCRRSRRARGCGRSPSAL